MHAADDPIAIADDWVRRILKQPGRRGTVALEGLLTSYLEWGNPASERIMVLLHGFLGHAHWWDFVAPWFACDYRVLAMDFAGMGDSSHSEHYSLADFTAQVGAFLALLPAPVILLGHSFGGLIALHAAQRFSAHISRCLIVDSRIGDRDRPPRPPTAQRPNIVYPDLDAACARFRFRPDEPPITPAIMRHLAEQSLQRVNGGYRWKFDARLMGGIQWDRADEVEVLRSVDLPIDFVAGELSTVVSPELAMRICATLKRGRGPIIVPAAHHHIPANQPLSLVAALRALLA